VNLVLRFGFVLQSCDKMGEGFNFQEWNVSLAVVKNYKTKTSWNFKEAFWMSSAPCRRRTRPITS